MPTCGSVIERARLAETRAMSLMRRPTNMGPQLHQATGAFDKRKWRVTRLALLCFSTCSAVEPVQHLRAGLDFKHLASVSDI
jgi:hypothetical protein